MNLPIGIQDFAKLRQNQLVYVDKTMYFEAFLRAGVFFLSRPRRFGKSLLLSTLKAIYEGRKDLFQDLWLYDKHDFKPRPVIRIDFSNISFRDQSLQKGILEWLQIVAAEYGIELQGDTVSSAFRSLILELSKTDKVVVLIDEYDKPITDYLLEPEKRAEHQATLKSLYGVLKPMDAYLHLVFLTGVSKIGKLSLFSDLNNLQDISLDDKYAVLCGYTHTEIETNFQGHLESLQKKFAVPMTELWEAIKHWYNGYSWDSVQKVYCPFSFLLFLEQQEFRSFWYETGTPTFLLEMIKKAALDPLRFNSIALDEMSISSPSLERLESVSLMFQTGYLTIKQKIISLQGTRYQLSYPNEEVRQAFSKGLLEVYAERNIHEHGSFGLELHDALIAPDWTVFFEICNRVFAAIPYEIFPKREMYMHSLMHLMLVSTGFPTQSQVQTSLGRIDTVVDTPEQIILFEFKLGGDAETALKQIKDGQYAKGYAKTVIGIGVVFDVEQKSIVTWQAETLSPSQKP